MIPDSGERVVDLRMVEYVIPAVPVVVIGRQRNPIDRKADMVSLGKIGVNAAIVLRSVKFGGVHGVVVGDVRDRSETAANAGVTRAGTGKILRAQGRGERCADVDALTSNGSAICALDKSGGGAGSIWIESSDNSVAWERKILGGLAS